MAGAGEQPFLEIEGYRGRPTVNPVIINKEITRHYYCRIEHFDAIYTVGPYPEICPTVRPVLHHQIWSE